MGLERSPGGAKEGVRPQRMVLPPSLPPSLPFSLPPPTFQGPPMGVQASHDTRKRSRTSAIARPRLVASSPCREGGGRREGGREGGEGGEEERREARRLHRDSKRHRGNGPTPRGEAASPIKEDAGKERGREVTSREVVLRTRPTRTEEAAHSL
jgi:hypothetical protein